VKAGEGKRQRPALPPPPRGASLRWLRLAAPAAGVLGLGCYGFAACVGVPRDPAAALNVLYLSLQLFFFESGMRCESGMHWTLQVARFLAPLVSISAVVWAFLGAIRNRLRLGRLDAISGHAVICGLGRKGVQLVRDFRARGIPVVAIDLEGDNDNLRLCREQGALTLVGNAGDESLLRQARVHRASCVVALSGDEGMNVEIALTAHRLIQADGGTRHGVVTGFVHIVDPKLCALFKQHPVFANRDDRFEIRVFNVPETSARLLFDEHPLDWQRIGPGDTRGAHLVCVGFGRTGEAAVLQAARICHLASGRRLRVSVIDLRADQKAGSFCGRYPRFSEVCDLEFIQGDVTNAAIIERIRRFADEPATLTTLLVCMNDDSRNLLVALQLQESVGPGRIQICVRMMEVAGLTALLAPLAARAQGQAGVWPFGIGDRVCTHGMLFDERQDALAAAIHAWDREHSDGVDLPPWARLSPARLDACRHRGAHVPVLLRAVGCQVVDSGGAAADVTGFTDEEAGTMARMEHARARAARLLDGGDPEDPAGAANERVRTFVQDLPALLRRAGLGIRRQEPPRVGAGTTA